MVRKSERNKPKGAEKVETQEKTTERGRKSGRQPRRKKKSESESEPEVEPDPPKKEVGEISEPKPLDAEKVGSRRSSRKNPAPVEIEKPPLETEKSEKNEWKEDPGFWGSEDSAPVPDSSKVEEATTWKIQSSNGSGGEIQKLKICRQRVANDSNDSSSPAQTKDSPRRKKRKHTDEGTESGGDVSSSNEAKDEAKNDVVSERSSAPASEPSGVKEPEEEEADSGEVTEGANLPSAEDGKVNSGEPQEDLSEETKVSEEVEIETSSRRASQEDNENSGKKSRRSSIESKVVENKSRRSSMEDVESADVNLKKSSTEEVSSVPEKEKKVTNELSQPETKTSGEENTGKHPRIRTKSETSEDGKGEKKLLTKVKVVVNSEDAIDEIAKKLNERAARFSKDENKEKKRESRVSSETLEQPKSPREEGELTPVPEQMRKTKHTTIIINKPKEVTSQPTRLKRNTDELPPTERKRRILLKSKSKDKEEDPINISSQSLMLLVPEVKTITPEQVASFPLEDVELTRFEMEDQSEEVVPAKVSKKKIDLKPKEVEVRVENDTRQVTKKKPIVIDTKEDLSESKSLGPRLPTQENHRVVRKISLVNEEIKKPGRSLSPGAKNQTEVLFITNLVRPFTVPQLRELLARTGTIAPNGFYIDKIKSKCYVKYTDVEMAVETRHALNGVRWPVNNPKTLKVEFVPPEEMSVVQQMADDESISKKVESSDPVGGSVGWLSEQAALKPQRRVTTAVREWDMGKIGAGPLEEKRPGDEWRGGGAKQQEQGEQKRRPVSPVETKYEPPARKIKKRDNDAPARLLDDLFRKTKATPCIYWLPLTAAQIAVKEEMRRQHMAENERRLAELRKTDHSRRDRDRDREKSRDRRKK